MKLNGKSGTCREIKKKRKKRVSGGSGEELKSLIRCTPSNHVINRCQCITVSMYSYNGNIFKLIFHALILSRSHFLHFALTVFTNWIRIDQFVCRKLNVHNGNNQVSSGLGWVGLNGSQNWMLLALLLLCLFKRIPWMFDKTNEWTCRRGPYYSRSNIY